MFLSRRMGAFDPSDPFASRPLVDPTDGTSKPKVADAEALWVRRALEAADVLVLPRETQVGGEHWKKHVFKSIEDCDLFIVFGTDSYGAETTSEYSTNVEWGNAKRAGKAVAHINMCDSDEQIGNLIVRNELAAKSLIYEKWAWSQVPTSMPDAIIPWLEGQLPPCTSTGSGGASASGGGGATASMTVS